MNQMPMPGATPAPLHDIAGPVGFFPYPIWMVAAAVLGILILLGLLVWFIATRRKPVRKLTPAGQALGELGRLRGEVESGEPYPFSIAVSDVLRVYLRDAHRLSATTQTSREFLETVRARHVFNDEEGAALAAFLEKADLVKFARMHASAADCTALVDQAERLVRSRPAEPEGVAK